MFSEKRIKEAVIKAKKRGLEIKVVLEKNPYMAFNINNKHYYELKKNNIDVVWSDPDKFTFNHAKIMIIDDEIILSTGNLTYSTFAYNMDFFLFIQDQKYLDLFNQIFLSDFNYKDFNIYDENLVLSPIYSREKLEKLLLSAKNEINMYFQYIQDEKLENILINKVKDGVNINIILQEQSDEKDKEKIKYLENNGIKIKYLDKIKQHSKMVLVDSEYLFIGSINFSSNSLDNNREIGLILSDEKIINKVLVLFKNDFN